MSDATDSLAAVPLFAGLDPEDISEIAAIARPFELPADHQIFCQGDEADAMYVLAEGAVRITARVPGDSAVVVADLGAGDVFGEMSLIDRGARSAGAECTAATTGWTI